MHDLPKTAIQSDADFLNAIGVSPNSRPIAIAIRRILASWCGVRPEEIRADAAPRELDARMKAGLSRGWDEAGFLMKLEDSLCVTIDAKTKLPPFIDSRFFFWSQRGCQTVAAWINGALKVLDGQIKLPSP